MITVNRSARLATAVLGAAGAVALAGCASTAEPAADPATEPTTQSTDPGSGSYADGTYTAEGSYRTPETTEQIEVTVTLEAGVITAVDVVGEPQRPESEQYQGRFIGGISDEVVGRSIDEISVSRVAGSSLTSGGFNEAIEQIKLDAQE